MLQKGEFCLSRVTTAIGDLLEGQRSVPGAWFMTDHCEEMLPHRFMVRIPLLSVFDSLQGTGGMAKAGCGLIVDPAPELVDKW